MASDLGCFCLPARSKLVHKDHVMRVPHRDWDAPHFAEGKSNGKFSADLGLAHGDLEFVLSVVAGRECTGLQASAGTNHNLFFGSLGANVGGNATCAIAGDLRLGSVGIEKARLHVGVRCGKQPLDSVGTHALMPVADAATEGGQVRWGVSTIDDQEIISAGACLDERNDGRNHSVFTGPSQVALSKTEDCFSRCRTWL